MAAKRKPWERRRSRGSGTIQRQRDGSYIARTTERSRSGRFPQGSDGYKAAEEALGLWNKQLGIGINPNDSRQRVRDFLSLWLSDVVAPDKRPRTLEFYTRHAEYATRYIGDLPLEAANTRAIEQLLGKLAKDGLSPRSVDHVRAVLHNAFNVAHRWYALPNPVTDVPRRSIPEQDEKAITAAQVAVLLAAVIGDRLEALYHIALTLGLRRGELLGLRWSDIDWEAGLIYVTQQVSLDAESKVVIAPYVKGKHSRPLPLTENIAAQLRTRQAMNDAEARVFQKRATERAEQAGTPIPLVRWNENDLIFCSEVGTMIIPTNFNRRFAKLVTRINARLRSEGAPAALLLPADLTPHGLRHTALTDLAMHGEAKAVQNIAGHADIDTTMRVYAGRRMGAMRDAVEKMEKGRKTG